MELFSGLFIILLTALVAFFAGRYSRFPAFWDKEWCSFDLVSLHRRSTGLVDAILLVDQKNGKILFADERAASFYGLESKELEGMGFKELLTEKENWLLPGQFTEQTHLDKQGDRIPVEVTSSEVRYLGRNAILIAVRSIREKRREERDADVQKAVIDASYNGIGIINLDRKGCPLIDANPALINAFEMPGEKVLGSSFFELLPDQVEDGTIRRRIQEGKGWKGEFGVDDGNGERWFYMSIDPLESSEKMERILAVVCQDITEKRKAENNLVDAIVRTQQKERRRLANDLHDGVGQSLTAANVYLKTMEKKWKKGEAEKGMEHLPMVSDLLQKGGEEIRNISHDLMPDTLKEYGLPRAIREMIGELDDGDDSLRIRFHTGLDPDRRHSLELETSLFRICQELINNAVRHSEADELRLTLEETQGEIVLEASDNGKGFDPEHLEGDGIGLKGLQDRVDEMHGTFEMDACPGEGAYFRISAPIQQERRSWETNTLSV